MQTEAVSVTSKEEQEILLETKRKECFSKNLATTLSNSSWCPATWDGVLCWKAAPPGSLAVQRCPAYIAGFNSQGEATRRCDLDGGWWVPEERELPWTNLSQCFQGETATVLFPFPDHSHLHVAKYLPVLKLISVTGYSVSLVSLLLAFLILASFRRLRCPRNLLHLHLFGSFILRALASLLKELLFRAGVGLAQDLAPAHDGKHVFIGEIQAIVSGWQYSILANYSWILMEGLYLHNLIFSALFSDSSSVTGYIALGWSLPLIVVAGWVWARSLFDDTLCWTTYELPALFLILKIPTILFMLVNFCLFVNIVRVLFLKLTASISEADRRKSYMRWAKSTLVLMPLFGVHFVLLIWVPAVGPGPTPEILWLFGDTLFTSFQGFLVATLYCFLNGEVRTELSKWWAMGRCHLPAPCSNNQSLTGQVAGESCMTTFLSSGPHEAGKRILQSEPNQEYSKKPPQELAVQF